MKFYLRMATESVLTNKRKFIHNIAGIAIGVMLLLLITSISMSFKGELYSQMKISDDKVMTIAVGDKNNTLSYIYLPVFDQNVLDIVSKEANINKSTGLKGVNVTSIYYKNSNGQNKRIINNIIYSSNQAFLDLYGATINDGGFCINEDEIVIGSAVAMTYGIAKGDYIDIDYLGQNYRLKVSGILGTMSAMGYSSTPEMINNIILLSEKSPVLKNDKYISIIAEVTNVSLLKQESEQITTLLNIDGNMTQELKELDMDAIVVNNLAILDMIDGYFEYVNLFIALLFFVISLIVILNFSNLMTITILSRSREIGIMKIIGGSNSQISKFYSIECLFTGFIGSIIGVVLGVLVNFAITYLLNWKFEFSVFTCLFTLLVGILSPTIAGMLTQRKIKKQSISDIFNKQ